MTTQDPSQPTLQQRFEYVALRLLVGLFRLLPRSLARAAGAGLGRFLYAVAGRLRKTGLRNLELALPEKSLAEREQILRGVYRSLGWQLAEFCKMSALRPETAARLIRYDEAGLERFLAAEARGKGVLVLTAHLGAWELSSFFHSLMGHPMSMVIRRLDNPLVDQFVDGIRSQHGNRALHKDDFARGLLSAVRRGETVGILMDTNMTPPQGVFVPFFGLQACTAAGLARVAMHSGAAVLPGYLVWHEEERRYVLHFGQELEIRKTGDAEADILANTALFNRTLEEAIRRYPEQWLWVHRRWKTRPEGEPRLY
ncbi:MAG: lysophospholipid acyltransferase family protein [Acidobacteriaceae bacterium]|nr:lysophospholipid acyltransferase family protein [Acidobacteriaceae bacterium]